MALVRFRQIEEDVFRALMGLPYDDYLRVMAILLLDLQVTHSSEQGVEVRDLMNEVLDVLKCRTAPSCTLRDRQVRRLLRSFRASMTRLDGRVSVGLWSELWTVETLVAELVGSAPKYDGAQTIVGVIRDTFAPPPPGLSLDDPTEMFDEPHPVMRKIRQFQAAISIVEAKRNAALSADLDDIYLSVFGGSTSSPAPPWSHGSRVR